MVKKATGIAVVMLLMFSLLGLVACNGVSLTDYKADAKADITAHVDSLSQSGYSAENWQLIAQKATEGKAAVDAATDKAGVDDAVERAKTVIDGVPKEDKMAMPYNAVLYSNANEWIHSDFLMANLTRGCTYIDESGKAASANGDEYPVFITKIVKSQVDFNEIFSQFPPSVNFENDILVVHIFTATTGNRPYGITVLEFDGSMLNIQYGLEQSTDTLSGNASAPIQRCLVIKMDSVNIVTAKFTQK